MISIPAIDKIKTFHYLRVGARKKHYFNIVSSRASTEPNGARCKKNTIA